MPQPLLIEWHQISWHANEYELGCFGIASDYVHYYA